MDQFELGSTADAIAEFLSESEHDFTFTESYENENENADE